MRIKELREKKKMRQEDLATRLNVDRTTVTKWETGETSPRTDKLPELAKALGCSINQLFGTK